MANWRLDRAGRESVTATENHAGVIWTLTLSAIATAADGAIKPLTTIDAGGNFGALGLLDTRPRTAAAVAVRDVLLLAERTEFLALLSSRSPRVVANLLTYLVDLIRDRTTPTAVPPR
jgi:CRP-like cAMP-binding protein